MNKLYGDGNILQVFSSLSLITFYFFRKHHYLGDFFRTGSKLNDRKSLYDFIYIYHYIKNDV